jgi:hypothetical protein
MANVFRSKEVYKNFRYDIDKTKKVVAVQGVYVASEYRPPYYNEPGIHIYEISGQHCTIADFKTEEAETQGMKTAGMYMFDITESAYTLERYSTQSKDATPTETAGMYMFDITESAYTLERYEKDYIDTKGMETAGMYMFDIVDSGYRLDIYGKKSSNSTPEPILRLSSLTSEACVVENYT